MNKKIIAIAIAAGIILIAGFLLVFFQQNNSRKEAPVTETLLTIETRGGLCPSGPCDAKIEIDKGGSYSYKNDNGKKSDGTFSTDNMDNLEEAIKNTDFAAIKSKKFTGQCPTDYDGQEFTYTFYSVKQVIPTCTYEVDNNSPLFKIINTLLSKIYSNIQ